MGATTGAGIEVVALDTAAVAGLPIERLPRR
jgi:hypothetical protein